MDRRMEQPVNAQRPLVPFVPLPLLPVALFLLLAPAGALAQDSGGGIPPYEARRDFLSIRPFVPLGVPEVAVEDRTVFYDLRTADPEGMVVILQPEEAVTALPSGVFRASGWLHLPGERSESLGTVTAFARDRDIRFGRTTVHPLDEVRLVFEVEGTPRVGDEFLIYRVVREIPEVGSVTKPTGRVEVTEVHDSYVIAKVLEAYDRMQLGDFVARVRTFPLRPGVHPVEADRELESRILAFQERKELYLPGDLAFITGGVAQGLSVGDEFVAVEEGEDRWSGNALARFQVVGVRDHVATVRMVTTQTPGSLRAGLRLLLDRAIP